MALSLAAEEILTEHRSSLAKAMKTVGQPGGAEQSQRFEAQLREQMFAELGSHASRAGRTHRYYWERLHRHATPEDLAALIEKARGHADATETAQNRDRDKQGGVEGRLAALEDHVFRDGQSGEAQPPVDTSSPEIGLRVARLLGYFRGQALGIEAKHSDRDEHAILTPDPKDANAARVVVFGPNGVTSQSSHASPSDALSHMAASGYTEPAPGSYTEHSESDDWEWLHRWAQIASSGDETALRKFRANHTHPATRTERRAEPDPTSRHREQLTEAVNSVIGSN